MTKYHVLRVNGGNDTFDLVARDVAATDSTAAIRAYATDTWPSGEPVGATGTYVAVPSRSWKLTAVTVKTETRILIGGTA